MMYSEFIEGTGCKDNEHNYKVYKDLELMYMNSDTLSKADIYEYGKKLVDNSKTAEQIEFENKIKAEIQKYKDEIKEHQEAIKREEEFVYKSATYIKYCKDAKKYCRGKIRELKWVLG